MDKIKYIKLEATSIRGICVKCLKNPQRKDTRRGTYRAICSTCDKKMYDKGHNKRVSLSKRPYRKYVKEVCERCNFIPEHSCQLDVDHIDGNHKNNDITNLQTLCANCHRLKTYTEKNHNKKASKDI